MFSGFSIHLEPTSNLMIVIRMPGPEHIKAYMKMILEGVGFLHKNWVLHRYVGGLFFAPFDLD